MARPRDHLTPEQRETLRRLEVPCFEFEEAIVSELRTLMDHLAHNRIVSVAVGAAGTHTKTAPLLGGSRPAAWSWTAAAR